MLFNKNIINDNTGMDNETVLLCNGFTCFSACFFNSLQFSLLMVVYDTQFEQFKLVVLLF